MINYFLVYLSSGDLSRSVSCCIYKCQWHKTEKFKRPML